MKFAVHLSLFTKKWGEDLSPLIFLSKELGFDGVELPLIDPDVINVGKIKKALDDTGLEALCSTGLNQENDISSLDETIRNNGLNFLKKCIDIASELGSKFLNGVTYSPWGFLQSRQQGQENIEILKKTLFEVAEYAQKKNVGLNIEVVNRYESYIFNTVSEAKEFIKEVNHPNLGIHYDTYHANIEEACQGEAILTGGDLIKHVHFASNYRGTPNRGSIDFIKIKEALEKIKYDDFICLENAILPDCEVGTGFNVWRKLEEDPIIAAKNGLKAMKEIMGLED